MKPQKFYSDHVFFEGRFQPVLFSVDEQGAFCSLQVISDKQELSQHNDVCDFGRLYILPGLIDTHVHVNEPGRTEWEGFETATQAAAAAGITMLVDMPLNALPPTVTLDALNAKIAAVKNKLTVDVGFWGGVIPENIGNLSEFLRSGIWGVKAFLIDSGVTEFPPLSLSQVEQAMEPVSISGLPFLFHAEYKNKDVVVEVNEPLQTYKAFVATRPDEWEVHAIKNLISMAKQKKAWVHIVHLSSAQALPYIKEAKEQGIKLTVETCPHYLCFDCEEIDRWHRAHLALFKCCPPIRDRQNRDQLWEALRSGAIDFVVSDHSPCTADLKRVDDCDLSLSWGGIAGLQSSLASLWSEAYTRGISMQQVVSWLTQGPRQLLGEGIKKGCLRVGFDADFIVWDPDVEYVLSQEMLLTRHKLSPYVGKKFKGCVKETYLRGHKIYDDQKGIVHVNTGKIMLRNDDHG